MFAETQGLFGETPFKIRETRDMAVNSRQRGLLTMAFRNAPAMTDKNNEAKIRRYVHSPLAIEHFGIHVKIQENGKVVISKVADDQSAASDDEVDYDEIEIPASLVFKLANALKLTRSIQWVSIADMKPQELAELKREEQS